MGTAFSHTRDAILDGHRQPYDLRRDLCAPGRQSPLPDAKGGWAKLRLLTPFHLSSREMWMWLRRSFRQLPSRQESQERRHAERGVARRATAPAGSAEARGRSGIALADLELNTLGMHPWWTTQAEDQEDALFRALGAELSKLSVEGEAGGVIGNNVSNAQLSTTYIYGGRS